MICQVFLYSLFAVIGYGETILREKDVTDSLRKTYPPYLAALIQQDLANARVRQAIGGFDATLTAQAQLRPQNFYDGSNYEVLLEKPLFQNGASVYGGYRLSNGFLPDYYRHLRTGSSGEIVLGFNVPILQDFTFNPRLAKLSKAEIERELAEPEIALQFIDMMKAGRLAYYEWLISGYSLMNTKEMLIVAQERQSSFQKEVEEGARPEIILLDNQRLMIERQLAANEAQARFENATLALSLFYRDEGESVHVSFAEMPTTLPLSPLVTETQRDYDIANSSLLHPALKRFELLQKRTMIELRLAKNSKKPRLDLSVELNLALRDTEISDIENTELTTYLNFSVPLGRNEAKGLEEEALQKLSQLKKQSAFTQEFIETEINVIHNSLKNNHQAYALAQTSEELAKKLLESENEKFRLGASNLLNLQLREQAYLASQLQSLNNLHKYYGSYANYLSVSARDARNAIPVYQN